MRMRERLFQLELVYAFESFAMISFLVFFAFTTDGLFVLRSNCSTIIFRTIHTKCNDKVPSKPAKWYLINICIPYKLILWICNHNFILFQHFPGIHLAHIYMIRITYTHRIIQYDKRKIATLCFIHVFSLFFWHLCTFWWCFLVTCFDVRHSYVCCLVYSVPFHVFNQPLRICQKSRRNITILLLLAWFVWIPYISKRQNNCMIKYEHGLCYCCYWWSSDGSIYLCQYQ